MSGRELEGTFSEAKESFRCNCTFSLTLPLIPISVGARMRRRENVLWLESERHGKDKAGSKRLVKTVAD